jgi:hypothetical protein
MEKFEIQLSDMSIRTIFKRSEGSLIMGDLVLFSQRRMLAEIYNQLPLKHKGEIQFSFPKTVALLRKVREIN